MTAGAVDVIEKPFTAERMLDSVRLAQRAGQQSRERNVERNAARKKLATLTPREQNLLEYLVAGKANKLSAYQMGISVRTVEIHRAHIMAKMRASSLSEVVRNALIVNAT